MTRCRAGASRSATASLLKAFDPVLYVSAMSERDSFTSAPMDMHAEVGGLVPTTAELSQV